jgi:hypothetical protein
MLPGDVSEYRASAIMELRRGAVRERLLKGRHCFRAARDELRMKGRYFGIVRNSHLFDNPGKLGLPGRRLLLLHPEHRTYAANEDEAEQAANQLGSHGRAPSVKTW